MKKFIYIIILPYILLSCNLEQKEKNKPVAKVHDKYLFLKEIEEIVPNNSSKEDSLLIANSYIKQWITKELILQKAELNLSNKEKDITKLINDYRTSILTHRYVEKLIVQKLDTKYTEKQLKDYYDQYKFNFTLSYNIIKALYIKIPANAPGLDRVKKIYRSTKIEEMEELENYCLLNANKFDSFSDTWIPARKLLNSLPLTYSNEEKYLKNHKYIEVKDAEYVYFVNIKDVRYNNSLAPFEYITNDLIQIVKNKKRIEFEAELEKEIIKEAKAKNIYTIY